MAAGGDSLSFLVKAAANRAPGKRQVRVVPREKFVDFAGGDDDDEDLDYNFNSGCSEDDSDKVSDDDEGSESGEDSDGDSDDSDNSETPDKEDSNISAPTTSGANLDFEAEFGDERGGLVCSLCLNFRQLSSEEGGAEIIQCDRCGLTVHECCYGVLDADSDEHSDNSENLTEPWFCEPCLSELDEPPYCELCPVRGGAMKRTDTKRWVHLLCALYMGGSYGITFGDVDLLSPASLSELNVEKFGAKPCSVCNVTDRLLARTGVCVKCDAGLCRTYFHVTCAQSAGFLVDAGSEGDDGAADPFYGLCALHSVQTVAKKKKRRFAMVKNQEKEWASKNRNRALSEREKRKLREKRNCLDDKIGKMDILYPQEKYKSQRLLHTSAEFLQRMQLKSELTAGIQKEEYDKEFRGNFTPDMIGKIHMPPAFSADFCKYHVEREKYIAGQTKKVHDLQKRTEQLKTEQTKCQEAYKKAEIELKRASSSVMESDRKRLRKLCIFLAKTAGKNFHLPESLKEVLEPPKQSRRLSTNLDVRSSLESTKMVPGTSKSGSVRKFESLSTSPRSRIEIYPCGTCAKSHDQHLLAHCDTCDKFYHLNCLDPPLAKMPKKSTQCGWECSNCARGDSSDDSDTESVVDTEAPRQLRTTRRRPVARFVPDATPTFRRRKRKRAGESPAKQPEAPAKKRMKRSSGQSSKDLYPSVRASPAVKAALELARKLELRPEVVNFSSRFGKNKKKSSGASKKSKRESAPMLEKQKGFAGVKEEEDNGSPISVVTEDAPPLLQFCNTPRVTDQVDVKTSKANGRKRMQYPKEKLDEAVQKVMAGELRVKTAARIYEVPRSTISRRVNVELGLLAPPKVMRGGAGNIKKEQSDSAENDGVEIKLSVNGEDSAAEDDIRVLFQNSPSDNASLNQDDHSDNLEAVVPDKSSLILKRKPRSPRKTDPLILKVIDPPTDLIVEGIRSASSDGRNPGGEQGSGRRNGVMKENGLSVREEAIRVEDLDL